jgi:putative ABC transport system permease protein
VLRTRWRKVWRDLAGNRVRTFLVVLSIAIGVFAIGTIVATQIMLEEDLTGNYLGTNPADAILFVQPFADELVHAAERVSGVAEVQARRSVRVRVQTGPDEWRSLSLDVVPDFNDQRINMGTMSINVLERTREIGVMRAVGASDGAILRIVLVEGVFVGLI